MQHCWWAGLLQHCSISAGRLGKAGARALQQSQRTHSCPYIKPPVWLLLSFFLQVLGAFHPWGTSKCLSLPLLCNGLWHFSVLRVFTDVALADSKDTTIKAEKSPLCKFRPGLFKLKNKSKFQDRGIFLSSNLGSVWILLHRTALVSLTDMGLSDKDTRLFVSGQRHLGVGIKIVWGSCVDSGQCVTSLYFLS